jgi:hypothetical protein
MTDTTTRPFRCPIGRSRVYQTFHWQKNTNGQVVHECSGCSVLFKDPDRFTRFELFEGSICRTQLQASLTALSAARRARQAARLCPQISTAVSMGAGSRPSPISSAPSLRATACEAPFVGSIA